MMKCAIFNINLSGTGAPQVILVIVFCWFFCFYYIIIIIDFIFSFIVFIRVVQFLSFV